MRTIASGEAVRIELAGDLAAAEAPWLEAETGCTNVFSSYEYAQTWWRHFGAGLEAEIWVVKNADGGVVAVLPLYRTRVRGLPALRFIGGVVADELGPVCAPADSDHAIAGLLKVMAASRGVVLVTERTTVEDGLAQRLGSVEIEREPSPVVDLDGLDWDGLMAGFSKNLRRRLRRMENKLTRERGLEYVLTSEPADVARDLAAVVALHRLRWGAVSGAFDGAKAGFHADFAQVAFERGWLRLWIARLDDEPAAAFFGLRYQGVECSYQSGRDPRFEQPSIGLLLQAHVIRDAAEAGCDEYRLLRGDEAYKLRFASRDRPVQSGVASTLPGARCALAGAVAARRRLIAFRDRLDGAAE
ncbi:MAG: GNAT family N-acetyltransferase [Baekduia sp.]